MLSDLKQDRKNYLAFAVCSEILYNPYLKISIQLLQNNYLFKHPSSTGKTYGIEIK